MSGMDAVVSIINLSYKLMHCFNIIERVLLHVFLKGLVVVILEWYSGLHVTVQEVSY